MRIALFTDTYLPQVNGVSRTLAHLVRHAATRGHEVALVTPRVSRRSARHTSMHVQLPAMSVFFYPEVKLAAPLGRAGRRCISRFDPDLVHCAVEGPVGWSGRRWAHVNAVPLVTSFHTNFPAYLGGYRLGWLREPAWHVLRAFHAPALRTFCPSRDTMALLEARGFGSPLRLWSRGVDPTSFSPAFRRPSARERLAPGAERILLYVGRIAPEKRLSMLEEAWGRIEAQAPQRTALVLVGDGPARAALERRGHRDMHFTGYLTGESLATAYASADVFVFPSDTETFGNVVAEAMASGVPVVTVDSGGVTDLVRPGETGLLATANDPRSFADAVLRLLSDDPLRTRMGIRARAEALGRSWDNVLDGLLHEYQQVVEAGSPPALAARTGGQSGATSI